MAEHNVERDLVDIDDDRPLAVRRKRRLSTNIAAKTHEASACKLEDEADHPSATAKTPIKSKKRVRFSDPGPDAANASSSTGLTPHLKRASFSPGPWSSSSSQAQAAAPRRLSFPTHLSTSLPSPSLSPSPVSISGDFQFEPLRQILDPRVKRRLRRNGLSEEVNSIEADQRERQHLRQEIDNLREQLALAKDANEKEHSDDENKERPSSEKVQKLEKQLADLKEEVQEQSIPMELPYIKSAPQRQALADIEIPVDLTEDDLLAPTEDDMGGCQDAVSIEASTTAREMATQVSLSPAHTDTLREARLSLERLFPGEITLGLVPKNPKPLLDVMLDRMHDLKAQVLVTEENFSRSQALESNLRNQFNAVLAQLERARKYAEGMRETIRSEKSRADVSEAKVKELEDIVHVAAGKVQSIEQNSSEKDRSIKKLQDALESYRVEVAKLEALITKTENEHNSAIAGIRAEMDEAVADLECHVVAETRGRREAENEVIEKEEKIKQLRHQEEELKNALHEKQQIIRETEKIFQEERVGREREVGGLNVHIGQLSTELSESNAKVLNVQDKERVLMKKLQEEREAGVRAVEEVQAKLARVKQEAEEVKTSYVNDVQRRGAEVTQHQGLLTPVSATRFKDIPGYVEQGRGKGRGKKRDSGIEILKEDEDEDTVMADDL